MWKILKSVKRYNLKLFVLFQQISILLYEYKCNAKTKVPTHYTFGQHVPSNHLWLPVKENKIFCLGAIQNLMQSIQTMFVKRTIKAIFNVQQTINLHV